MNKERLLKLADFLEKLPEEKFDFGEVVKGQDIPNETLTCGSVACGIGWAPVVFPEACQYKRTAFGDGDVSIRVIVNDDDDATFFEELGATLFDISIPHAEALFGPDGQAPRLDQSLKALYEDAKPAELAANIRAYVQAFSTSNP